MQSKLFKAALIMLLMGGVLSAQIACDTEIKWMRLQGMELTTDNDPVLLDGVNLGGCISMNKLEPTEDGAVSITVSSATSAIGFGMGVINSNPSDLRITDYAFVLKGGYAIATAGREKIYLQHKEGTTATYQIERIGSDVTFSKLQDGRQVVMLTITEQNPARLHADFIKARLGINGPVQLRTSFANYLKVGRIVEHVTCSEPTIGAIALEIIAQKDPDAFTVTWSNGATGKTITGLEAGDYTASIFENGELVSEEKITVSYEVEWQELNNITRTHEIDDPTKRVYKKAGADSDIDWNNASARSENHFNLVGDGFVEFSGDYYGAAFSFGLSTKQNPGLLDMSHSFVYSDGAWYIFEEGITTGLDRRTAFKANPTDALRLERVANEIYYYRVDAEGNKIALRADPTPAKGYNEFFIDLVIASGEITKASLTSNVDCEDDPDVSHVWTSVKRKLDGSFARLADDRILRFKYREEYREGDDLRLFIYRSKRGDAVNTTPDSNPFMISRKYGINYLEYSLAWFDSYLGPDYLTGFWILEVVNDKNESQFLRFIAD